MNHFKLTSLVLLFSFISIGAASTSKKNSPNLIHTEVVGQSKKQQKKFHRTAKKKERISKKIQKIFRKIEYRQDNKKGKIPTGSIVGLTALSIAFSSLILILFTGFAGLLLLFLLGILAAVIPSRTGYKKAQKSPSKYDLKKAKKIWLISIYTLLVLLGIGVIFFALFAAFYGY